MLQLIINPAAGNGHAARVGERMIRRLQEKEIAYTAAYTERAGHATHLAREAVSQAVPSVIAIGGDGTVLEVVRGIHGTNTALGIIPAGTGNDVSKMLHVPKKPEEALDFLLARPARTLDMGSINGEPFLNVCGTGFDVCVLDYALTAKRYVRGMLPYLWGVIRTIFTYAPVEATFEVDGEPPFTRPVLILAIANGRYIGGGMDVAPKSAPDDGLLDFLTIESMPNWKMPFQLLKLLSGRILDIPGVGYRRCCKVTLSAKGMRVNIDGEIVPMEKATLEIRQNALLAHW